MARKKMTHYDYQEKVNEILHLIHSDIAAPLHVKDLAEHVSTSPFHFNRIFKQVMDEHLHGYIRRVRLESAANLLLFNPTSSITEIAGSCGFASLATFTHAFKERFAVTPTQWREVDVDKDVHLRDIAPLDQTPVLVQVPPRRVAYVRHQGYDKSIQKPWSKLLYWAKEQGIKEPRVMVGLHHSNPRFVEKKKCHYVACLEVGKGYYRSGDIGVMIIPTMFCAKFHFEGKYGDLLRYMDSVYYRWLPQSDFEKINLPSFALYHKNHFIEDDERFVLDFYIPVRYR